MENYIRVELSEYRNCSSISVANFLMERKEYEKLRDKLLQSDDYLNYFTVDEYKAKERVYTCKEALSLFTNLQI